MAPPVIAIIPRMAIENRLRGAERSRGKLFEARHPGREVIPFPSGVTYPDGRIGRRERLGGLPTSSSEGHVARGGSSVGTPRRGASSPQDAHQGLLTWFLLFPPSITKNHLENEAVAPRGEPFPDASIELELFE